MSQRTSTRRGPRPRDALAVVAVVLATLLGVAAALGAYRSEARLSVGTVGLSVAPGHPGALDVYVPLVDWGARFGAIRLPARLQVEVRAVDRSAVARIAEGGRLDVRELREEAQGAVAGYLRRVIVAGMLLGLALGALVALALRQPGLPRLRWTGGAAAVTAALATVMLAVLLPPRGDMTDPEYYAHGADIPRALEALEGARRSVRTLDSELDQQLVGLARLVVEPAERVTLADRPQLLLASDLHNNLLAVPTLERLAADAPLVFAGDLTDRGTPLEGRLVRRVVGAGDPFVFVSGNHDSDTLEEQLARDGAIVLGRPGDEDRVVEVGGLRMAGYGDPFIRRRADNYRDRYVAQPTEGQRVALAAWLERMLGRIDVAVVHQPALAAVALERLHARPPAEPLVLLTGHTHRPEVERLGPRVTMINGGSIGAGGPANFTDPTNLGVARLVYAVDPTFQPLAADLVEIDPGTGSSFAHRVRLDVPAPAESP